MGFLFRFAVLLFLISGCLEARSRTAEVSQASLREARAYSFLVRDQGLSHSETMALLQGSAKLSDLVPAWIASPEHQARMERYFDDMMGFREQLNVVQPNARLTKAKDGLLFSPRKGGCVAADAVSVHAWWLPEGARASFCPNLVKDARVVNVDGKTIVCAKAGPLGFLHPSCGCGPDMINCIAPEEANRLQQEVQQEFAARAWEIYQNNQTWLELLASRQFHGTRRLYWLYFQTQSQHDPKLYSDEAIDALNRMPLDQAQTMAFPVGAERAGIATAPGFLVQFNNFRSRIAGLTRSFLCQDMNPTLNTDGISTFVNPSLKPVDLAHSEKEGCSGCHYALDNLGGAVMPWTDRGVYQPRISTTAHVFGEAGQGPAFLMQGFIERGPGFQDCMARRAWEDFSGQAWEHTAEAVKAKVRGWVHGGPRSLVQTLLLSEELRTTLASGPNPGPSDDLSPEIWTRMKPLVQDGCSGSSCHSRGTRQPAYAEDSQLWVQDREKLQDRLQRTGSGQMPPRSRVLSDEARQTLLQILM